MLQIGKTIISRDIIESNFVCDLNKCKGACCVYGDSGAPLKKQEVKILDKIYPALHPYLRREGIESIEKNGTSVIDIDGDIVTPLINNKECAYTYFENDTAKCAIEKAYFDNAINFQKPASCHLYPIRLRQYPKFIAVNYHQWEICKPAIQKGNQENIRLYRFLKDALIHEYGLGWYEKLETAEKILNKNL